MQTEGKKKRPPKLLRKTLKKQAKELKLIKKAATVILEDPAAILDLIRQLEAWLITNGELIQCTIYHVGDAMDENYAKDVLADFKAPWTEVQRYVLYEIITHHGNKKFSFENMRSLVDHAQEGNVRIKGLGIPPIKGHFINTRVFTLNGAIPYNPLNMQFKFKEHATIREVIHNVKHSFGWPSRDIKIYANAECTDALEEDMVLKNIHAQIRQKKHDVLELYMEFTMGYVDNPLIFSDYYFENRTVDEMIDEFE